MTRRAAPALLAAGIALAAVLVAAGPASPQPSAASSSLRCPWVGPVHGTGRANAAFPDTGAAYWTASISLPEGARLTLRGRYPHARYMSLNAYDAAGVATASLTDVGIAPERGSTNPFVPGADRAAARRSYRVEVSRAPTGAPNQLAAGSSEGRQVIIYRVYVPDRGRDLSGGAGLPSVELRLGSGKILSGAAACRAMGASGKLPASKAFPRADYEALREQPGKPAGWPAKDPPRFSRTFNVTAQIMCAYRSVCEAKPILAPGQYSNLDNAYASALVSRSFPAGSVLVLTGTMPKVAATWPSARRMPANADLRYWSICQNESMATTRVASCLPDYQVPLRGGRRYVIVSSTPKDRPKNARVACRVAWLPWPKRGDGAGHLDDGLLILRNMLPRPGFDAALQSVGAPGEEASVMGSDLPVGRYTTKAAFERLGCPAR